VPAVWSCAAARGDHAQVRSTTQGARTMPIAADYPFLDILWTMILFFTWVIWIWMMVAILTDVFRRRDISGWTKAAWTVFLIVVPFLAALVYLIAQHDGMAERSAKSAAGQRQEFDEYVKQVAGEGGAAAEIEKAQQLRDNGTIDQREFETLKAKALAV
jgi:hypothetical protein